MSNDTAIITPPSCTVLCATVLTRRIASIVDFPLKPNWWSCKSGGPQLAPTLMSSWRVIQGPSAATHTPLWDWPNFSRRPSEKAIAAAYSYTFRRTNGAWPTWAEFPERRNAGNQGRRQSQRFGTDPTRHTGKNKTDQSDEEMGSIARHCPVGTPSSSWSWFKTYPVRSCSIRSRNVSGSTPSTLTLTVVLYIL